MTTTHQTTPTPTEGTDRCPARRHPRTVHLRSHYDVDGTWVALCGWRAPGNVGRVRRPTDTITCPACEAQDALWFGVNA